MIFISTQLCIEDISVEKEMYERLSFVLSQGLGQLDKIETNDNATV
jgi:hypothetical protein